jgi:hypothetical protein
MKRLLAHPSVGQALAEAAISPSWARAICAWTDQLPEDGRDEADTILLAAAAGGATLADLAGLAEEMRRRAAGPDEGGDHGFDDRSLWLGLTFAGAGRLTGDLTPACAAALSAVLEALGKKTGPEDGRSLAQRRHDALEEACQRLIGAGLAGCRRRVVSGQTQAVKPRQQRPHRPIATGANKGACRHSETPHGHHRSPVMPGPVRRRRGHPQPPRPHQQRRLQPVLALHLRG